MISALDVLHDLRNLTSTERGCTRVAYTHLEDEAHDYVWDRMRSIDGLVRIEDAAGNMFVVPDSASSDERRRVVLVGSHLDTVIEGGWLDGSLGVAVGMEVLSELAVGRRPRPGVGLVVFRDEEGVRFNTGLFGSRVFAGMCEPAHLDVMDQDGVKVREVVPDPEGCVAYAPPVDPIAFLECHIEQGIRLIEGGKRIGVVTGMVGIRRFEIRGRGIPNHAGTTDMRRRVDALVPVAALVSRLPELVNPATDAVITCGRLTVRPGAANIIPGAVDGIIEIRAGSSDTIDGVEERLHRLVADIRPPSSLGPMAQVHLVPVVDVEPTPTNHSLVGHLEGVLRDDAIDGVRLPSMAGHDTQHAARCCPAGMFFIPSIGGISHSPEEDSSEEDIRLAARVMRSWVERCLVG